MVIVMGIFLAVMLKFNYYSRKSIILLLLVILSSVVIDAARMTITGSSRWDRADIADCPCRRSRSRAV